MIDSHHLPRRRHVRIQLAIELFLRQLRVGGILPIADDRYIEPRRIVERLDAEGTNHFSANRHWLSNLAQAVHPARAKRDAKVSEEKIIVFGSIEEIFEMGFCPEVSLFDTALRYC